MDTFTIGQVAERSGFSTSALRYYEEHGVIAPIGRTAAGYRLYDDTSLERLRFVARAKELGCSLEEIAELAELWAAEDCGPVQRRLHELVTDKIADARRRSTELIRFTAQLQEAGANLRSQPVDGACDDGCACLGGPSDPVPDHVSESTPIVLGDRVDSAIACSLPADEMAGRVSGWERLIGYVVDREALPDAVSGVRLVLDRDVPLDELTGLALAEQGCCSFFAFAITIDRRGIALEVRAPDDAADLVDAVFGTAA